MLLMPARRLVLKAVKPGETQISGIVFDMDGTLTKPQSYMFKQMRQALGIVGKKVDILDYIGSLDGDKKIVATKKVEDVENQAMIDMKPQNGVNTLFHFMRENTNLKFTICTRNNIAPVDYLLKHYLDGLQLNDPIITRSFEPPKPSPLPLLHICKSWNVGPETMIMVGDSRDDMFAGLQAGFSLVLMKHKDNAPLVDEIPEIAYVINDFRQLIEILQNGFISRPKKPRYAAHTSGY